MAYTTRDERALLDRALSGLKRDRWIPLKEFTVGRVASIALSYQERSVSLRRKGNPPLRIDLVLVSKSANELEDRELEHYKQWPGKYGYMKFNQSAPEWKGHDDQIFLSEMSRLLSGRDIVIVECKALKEKVKGEYGPHMLFHGLGQVLLYYALFIEDFKDAGFRSIRTAVLINEFIGIERRAYEKLREMFGSECLPFNTILWDTSLADKEFFDSDPKLFVDK